MALSSKGNQSIDGRASFRNQSSVIKLILIARNHDRFNVLLQRKQERERNVIEDCGMFFSYKIGMRRNLLNMVLAGKTSRICLSYIYRPSRRRNTCHLYVILNGLRLNDRSVQGSAIDVHVAYLKISFSL